MNDPTASTPWEHVRNESLATMTDAERAEYDAAATEAEVRLQRAELAYRARMNAEHSERVAAVAGKYSEAYPAGYLDALRSEWPE